MSVFNSLIIGEKFDKRNAYLEPYGLLKTTFKDQNKFRNENPNKNISTKPWLSNGIDKNLHF